MSGLKTIKNFGVGQQGRQRGIEVTPDEMDIYMVEHISHPGTGVASIGTAAGTAGSGGIAPLVTDLDYPRNVLVTVITGAGTAMGGTIVVSGQDQFGGTLTETIAVASVDPGGTTAGTAIFARIGTMTYTKVASLGTINVGYPSGTAAGIAAIFGLSNKIGGTADIKRATWIDNDVAKQLAREGAAPAIFANTTNHSVRIEVSGGIVAADSFRITYKPTKDLSAQGYQAGL